MEQKNWTVISLGGSLVYPDIRDETYVKSFVDLIKSKLGASNFAIITGGGKLARVYQEERTAKGPATGDELDTLGIVATRENAEFVRTFFADAAEPEIFLDPEAPVLTGKAVLVGGGWKPGRSSDHSAVTLAKTLGAKRLINLSNIDYVYTSDPRKNPDAKPLPKMTWAELHEMLPKEWNPGMNAPFDPIAAVGAAEIGLEVAVMNGKNLENLSSYLDGKEFIGTVIS